MKKKYETKLSKDDEAEFKKWMQVSKENGTIHPEDNGDDYDFRGFWKDLIKDADNGKDFSTETHFPDTYKKPNHETFSVESKYAKGNLKKYAGTWNGDEYIPSKERYKDRKDIAEILYE